MSFFDKMSSKGKFEILGEAEEGLMQEVAENMIPKIQKFIDPSIDSLRKTLIEKNLVLYIVPSDIKINVLFIKKDFIENFSIKDDGISSGHDLKDIIDSLLSFNLDKIQI
jgi:hypothetical protein